MRNLVAAILMTCLGTGPVVAQSVSAKDVAKLATETKLIAVTNASRESFKPDNDPDTLEIVFLPKGEKSEVGFDGEVIFQAEGTSDEQTQQLIQQAFALKVLHRTGTAKTP